MEYAGDQERGGQHDGDLEGAGGELLDKLTILRIKAARITEPPFQRTVALAGLPAAFWPQWQANHAAFPQGVDVFFTCGAQALGLPRTARVAL